MMAFNKAILQTSEVLGLRSALTGHSQLTWYTGSRRYIHQTQICSTFKQLSGTVDTASSLYQRNYAHNKALADKFKPLLSLPQASGDARAIERHLKVNKKLLVRDRLALLFDNVDDMLEISPLAGIGLEYGDVPRGGLVTAIGKINGVYCIAIANDATVKAGTMYPISVKKQVRSLEISIENGLPCVYVVDSGGAFLPMQADIFPDRKTGGRTFYNEAIINSLDVPQLAIVCGSCTAGAAYVPTMAQEAIIVNRIGTIFLAGPPLVKAALGEIVSPDDLGGATLHCSTSGCTDYYAETEQEAFELGRSSVAAFNIKPIPVNSDVQEPAYDANELHGIIPHSSSEHLDMYKVIARLVDASLFHEFKATYGRGIIAGFCYINGNLVGIVANNGSLDSQAALKASHFVQLCSQRRIALIFLQNIAVTDVLSQTHLNDTQLLRNQAKLLSSVACCAVPVITVVVGNSFGMQSYMMGSSSMGARFLFCWPNARICITEPSHLAAEIVTEQIKKTNDSMDAEKLIEMQKKVVEQCFEKSTALYSSSHGWDDGIILPENTRKVLTKCLEIVQQNPRFYSKQETPKAVLRM